jgi:ABC-2 type transport system permease protein
MSATNESALVWHQTRYDVKALLRNRQSRFFTLALPVLFLVVFASVFGHRTLAVLGGGIHGSVYYVPGIITYAIVAAAFANLVISVTAQRESGVLKRRRATPVPARVLIAGRSLTAVAVGLVTSAVILGIGWAAYGASIPAATAPALAVSVIVGAITFCCLGYAVAALVRDADAAQPVTLALILPLFFISGVFVPTQQLPGWLLQVGNVFPIRHLQNALLTAYNPHTSGAGFAATDLAVLGGWALAGLAIALWRFRWVPNR